ncbi:hypothetical protein BB561_005732 [Smittium simulii]|uniref:ethanolamine kinase n=1 Tax=Smittium simulii TaxID=133385 RepID=A0A2T9Y8R0_9FUNG|nr:hypothetical protein BB561_005732 [Smittium simulii]
MQKVLDSIPFYDYTIHDSSLFEDAKNISLNIFPSWKPEDLSLTQFTEGITNKRKEYGRKSEYIIDRQREIFNTLELSKVGLAQKIYCRFNNGIVYGYTEGTTVSPKEITQAPMINLIPKTLAKWHNSVIGGDKSPVLFVTLKKWLANIPDTYSDPKKDAFFKNNFSKHEISEQIAFIENQAIKTNSPVSFCHNDLLSGNILLAESKDSVSFIDFEYGAYNYRGYDIANHFCEYAGFECDYTRYPNREHQAKWLTLYLSELHSIDQAQVNKDELENLIYEISVFANASSLYWGIWSLIQANFSEIDFDYLSYAKLRFDHYYLLKSKTDFK